MRSALVSMLTLAFAAAGSAVIIDSGDGTGNVTAPNPDPGWSYGCAPVQGPPPLTGYAWADEVGESRLLEAVSMIVATGIIAPLSYTSF